MLQLAIKTGCLTTRFISPIECSKQQHNLSNTAINMPSNLLQSCWAAHAQLLLAEGLSEKHLQQTWQAVCSGISSSVQMGREHKVPGICTVLPTAASGIKVRCQTHC